MCIPPFSANEGVARNPSFSTHTFDIHTGVMEMEMK
jgi:hypothetical protein